MADEITVTLCATTRVIDDEVYVSVNDIINFLNDVTTELVDNPSWVPMMTLLGMFIRLNGKAKNGG